MRTVHVVPHTHWDREWYKPYPLFRMQLVELVDLLLDTLEADERYRHFQLDGQMAVIDDYLEIRPDGAGRLRRLNEAGRTTMGPWYTLPDEFLVSGETHVRNLRMGLARAEDFGGAMTVGYLPDMFGHVAQMPQILAGFGFEHAVVWRGVPSEIEAPAFWWEAPDGSRVRAEYLSDGYSNGARLPADGAALLADVEEFRRAQGPLVGDSVLWMNGTDHQLPEARLVDVVAQAHELAGGAERYEITSLAEHLAKAPVDGLPTWEGEMRSGARTNVLMGVASCRTDVKQAAALAERSLERVAEPLNACWLPAADWPGAFLDVAWRDVVRNAAHDSICGCSADEVNRAVLHRYSEATIVAQALTDRALVRALSQSGQPAVVVNPSARNRSGVVSTILPGDVAPPDTQQVSLRPAVDIGPTLEAEAARAVVLRAALDDPRVSRAELVQTSEATGDEPSRWTARLIADRSPKAVDHEALRKEIEAIVAAEPGALFTLETVRRAPSQEVLVRTGTVPGFGWRGLSPAPLGHHAVRADGVGLTNGLITVGVNQNDGTFSLNGLEGLGRLVDDGDAGDTYNWSPPAEAGPVQRPDDVDVLVTEAGPVRGRIEVSRRYRWPTHVSDDRRVGSEEVVIVTTVELRAGEDVIRVSVELDNQVRDHRLRIHFPLPASADGSEAECAFGTVRRGLTAEGGPNEFGLPTFSSQRFVTAGGLLVVHDGLPEYEVLDREIAVTLFRSVGVISQGPMRMRALPAGPSTPTPEAQMIGRFRADLVLHTGGRDPYAVADDAFTPLLVSRMPSAGFGDAEASGRRLTVTGAEVSALTRRPDGRLELRVFNPSATPAELTVEGRVGEVTDLRGDPTGERFDTTMTLAPHRVATLALDD
ncbi:MAG: hypothetical protein GX643_01430 [Acidimicrobiales bacterium]|nr:hypothetical protein [Acidimicrobiales bacterium]